MCCLDELKDYQSPQDILGKQGVLTTLTNRLVERALQAELTNHLGMNRMLLRGGDPATRATAPRANQYTPPMAHSRWTCPVTGKARLNPCWSKSGNGANRTDAARNVGNSGTTAEWR
jgi:hypothetical protein